MRLLLFSVLLVLIPLHFSVFSALNAQYLLYVLFIVLLIEPILLLLKLSTQFPAHCARFCSLYARSVFFQLGINLHMLLLLLLH